MKPIAFIDTEIEPNRGKILDIGSVKGDGNSFHSGSIADFIKFLDGSWSDPLKLENNLLELLDSIVNLKISMILENYATNLFVGT